jgi:RNA polymerase sigma-70 factor (ECF subfamily)
LLKSATQQPSEPIADDELLLAKARRGDIAAFEQLYRQHLPMVYGLAARLTLDTHLAEDLTQEVFIKVWQRLDRFGERVDFRRGYIGWRATWFWMPCAANSRSWR